MIYDDDDPKFHAYLVTIIDAFEQAALESNTREGVLVSAQRPLEAYDQILENSVNRLYSFVDDADNEENEAGYSPTSKVRLEGKASISPLADIPSEEDFEMSASLEGEVDVDFNTDQLINDLLGGVDLFPNQENDRSPAQWFAECLGCDLRVNFKWQLKPINLLASIDRLIDDIESIIDRFRDLLNPFNGLRDLCNLLNALKTLCIPDIIMILASLRMTIKRYTVGALNIKLSWTAVLGPILKAVIQGINSLLTGIHGVINAPLDCAMGSLRTSDQLLREISSIANSAKGIFNGLTEEESLEAEAFLETTQYEWLKGTAPSPFNDAGVAGGLVSKSGKASRLEPNEDSLSIYSGFNLNAEMNLEEAIRNPRFANATIIQKLMLPIQDFQLWLKDMVQRFNDTLKSLEALTGNGIGVNLNQLGILLFLIDLFNIITMAIRMLTQHPGDLDWCNLLKENPDILEVELRRINPSVTVESSEASAIRILIGSEEIGRVVTCEGITNGPNGSLLEQWISELE